MIKFKPKIVIGFGGYTTFAPMIAAKVLGVKTIIHEQNSIMGRANRLLSIFVDKVAITYKNTRLSKKGSIFTGIPIRNPKKTYHYNSKKKIILIIGGSQGAKVFSEIIPKIISKLDYTFLKKISLVQQIKIEDKLKLTTNYNKLNIDCKLKPFFDDIYNEIFNSSIIICRCGSSTLAEIELFKKFCFLFPLPESMDNHQHLNAIEFKKTNQCIIVDEKKIDYSHLAKEIKKNLLRKRKAINNVKNKNLFNGLIDEMLA